MIVGVIPARYAATRLPGKPLIDLEGKTMVQRVVEAVEQSNRFDVVVVATDDDRVVDHVRGFGGYAVLTPPECPSGTDRVLAALHVLELEPDIVVNIQGDEPLLPPTVLSTLLDATLQRDADVWTPVIRLTDEAELSNPNVVKVVTTADSRALYFTRAGAPYVRDGDSKLIPGLHWKHVGIYAFTLDALREHVALPPSPLEQAEFLEQLRLLEHGALFRCVEVEADLIAVDTPHDAERVRQRLRMK